MAPAGCPAMISPARFGPESTPVFRVQVSSRRMADMVLKVSISRPLVVWTRIWSPRIESPTALATSLKHREGTAIKILGAPLTASSRFVVARMSGASSCPLAYTVLVCCVLISRASSSRRTHISKRLPPSLRRVARAVPKLPPPTIRTSRSLFFTGASPMSAARSLSAGCGSTAAGSGRRGTGGPRVGPGPAGDGSI